MRIPHLGSLSIPDFQFLLSRVKEFKEIKLIHQKLIAISATKNHDLSSNAELKEKVRSFMKFVTASMKDFSGTNRARLQTFNNFWISKIKK